MIKNEYLTVKEMSNYHQMTTRNVRKIIAKLLPVTSPDLLFKDINSCWKLHHILISKFKPRKKLKTRYYALSIDLCKEYSDKDVAAIMKYVYDNMQDANLEINYTHEKKKANKHSHLHCFINCNQKRKLLNLIRVGFANISFKEDDIYDLQGWKDYITKEGINIVTLKSK